MVAEHSAAVERTIAFCVLPALGVRDPVFKDPRTVYPGNPLLAPEFIRSLPTIIYMPQGIPGLVDIWPDPRWLSVIRAITMVAWVFAAIGLFWRASAIVTALGFFTGSRLGGLRFLPWTPDGRLHAYVPVFCEL